MKQTGPRAELLALRRYLTELETHFLARHLSPATLGPPKRAEILDVGAYVVLAHGAMENFIEGLALWVLKRLVDNWGGVPYHVEKEKWRILPVGEVHDQRAALQGGHRRNTPWARVSASQSERMSLSPSR